MGDFERDFSIISAITGFISGIFLYYSFSNLFILYPFALFLPFLKYSKKLALFIFFIIAGITLSFLKSAGDVSDISRSGIEEVEGVILSKYKDTPFSSGYVVRIKKVKSDGEEKNFKGKILLEIKGKRDIERGRIVEIKNVKLKVISPPKNPGDIDFRNYWKRKNIFFECEGDVYLKEYSSFLSFLISKIRKRIKTKIEKYFRYCPEEKELIETITIGKEKIPRFLKEIGIKTGTYHLLVISGIHLSFILLLLKILFLPFQRINNTHPKLFPFLSLVFLWLYAEITGFRIPVIRAVLMFTFFFFGELFERDIDGISSIIMAAFTFLLFSPSSIFDVSFQLSFFATLGIVLFYRKFKKYFQKNVIFSIILLTISAQIFVFPLILYHFGNFSIGGIFNNIIFVPFTGIIVIFSFLFFFIPFFSIFVEFLLSFYLKSLVFFSSFSPLIQISFSIFSLILSYTII
ncbi:ComEC/Rec2 family competence protein, partial [bacterium]|nr:ComEC/Rec2 family competence protein [bacterium]